MRVQLIGECQWSVKPKCPRAICSIAFFSDAPATDSEERQAIPDRTMGWIGCRLAFCDGNDCTDHPFPIGFTQTITDATTPCSSSPPSEQEQPKPTTSHTRHPYRNRSNHPSTDTMAALVNEEAPPAAAEPTTIKAKQEEDSENEEDLMEELWPRETKAELRYEVGVWMGWDMDSDGGGCEPSFLAIDRSICEATGRSQIISHLTHHPHPHFPFTSRSPCPMETPSPSPSRRTSWVVFFPIKSATSSGTPPWRCTTSSKTGSSSPWAASRARACWSSAAGRGLVRGLNR